MDKADVPEKLQVLIDRLEGLRQRHYKSPEWALYEDEVTNFLKTTFGDGSDEVRRFAQAWSVGGMFFMDDGQVDSPIHLAHVRALDDVRTALLVIKSRVDRGDYDQARPEERSDPVALFDSLDFHQCIVEVARPLFTDGHYAQAILEAFKAVNNMVKDKSGVSDLDGKRLMGKVFDESAPIVKLNPLETQSHKDEQEGFKFLFMGAMQGIRNPKAHDTVAQTDPLRTLHYLALASLLAKRAHEGETAQS